MKNFKNLQNIQKNIIKIIQLPKNFSLAFKYGKKNYNQIKRNNPTSFLSKEKNIGAKFAINQFSDMTEEEFKSKYIDFDLEMYRDLAPLTTIDLNLDDVEPPENFDWELDKGIKSEVKHQMDCGGCWAFATTSALEAQYQILTGKNISFSEQQLIDCDENNLKCNGGNMKKAFLFTGSWFNEIR